MWVAFALVCVSPHCRHFPPLDNPRIHMPLNGMDSAASALGYWERKQEVVSNNLANVSTDGFKSQRVFATLLDGIRPSPDAITDLSTGNLKETGNNMDVAMKNAGFLVVSTPNGERYTRGGSLREDDKHFLVDENGNKVLGVKNGPMKLLPGPINIDADGTVTQGGQIVDVLRVENGPKGAQLAHEGERLWVPGATKQVVAPKDREIKQGYIEESNVNSMSALVDMVAVQRAYSSVQKAITEMDKNNETITTQLARPL
jgi:flagellar basal-body rod protein FlgF